MRHITRIALLLGAAGGSVGAASLDIALTNQLTQRVPLLLVDGELGSTNQIQYTPILRPTNDWQSLAEIVLTNHPTPYVDGTATNVPERFYRARALDEEEPPTNPPTRAPIYFNLFYHQEAVGSICSNFPGYASWRSSFQSELNQLELRGVVSDQYLSDYMVSVILYHDPADPLFALFARCAKAHLGYHFHPASDDVLIRVNQVRDLEFWAAVQAYPTWEQAYYDWSRCTGTNCMYCGSLNTNSSGGIGAMEAAFGKPCVVENLSVANAAVSLALQASHTNLVAGVSGAIHTYYTGPNLPHVWKRNWDLSPDLYRYVYKLMGIYRQRGHSLAWIEPSMALPLVRQTLALLPPDRAHIVMVHGYNGGMTATLDYLQQFMATNPGCRFISAAELPQLVDTNRNARSYSPADLEEGAQYLLRNWHGRPPGFIVTQSKNLCLAAFFKALQTALSQYYAQGSWPDPVIVPDFVPPPLGEEADLPSLNDWRTYLPVPVTNLAQVIQGLSSTNIPFVVELPPSEGPGSTNGPVKIHAAELLNGMCTLFLKHRARELFSEICLLKGHIIPLSNLPSECDCSRCCGTGQTSPPVQCPPCQAKTTFADSRLEWYNQLQLWTLEPLDLCAVQAPQAR